jgi:hypothetical protein
MTPRSSARACLGPLVKLVSIKRKKIGPIKTRLSINPKTIADSTSSNIQ